jgi:GNAT superfamily N-acetyltransferase
MPELEIVPFAKEHLEAAAALVADRYRSERDLTPLFPTQYENPAAVLPLLNFRAEERLGIAAVRNGKTSGFMLSFPFSSWGIPAVWIPDCGHGAEKPERGYLYRRMYAALAEQWVRKGHRKHLVMTFGHEREVLDAFFGMGFGMSNIDALRDLSPVPETPASVEIRQAGPEDFNTLMNYRELMCRHLAASPVFLFIPGKARAIGAKEFRRQLKDNEAAIWLACGQGKVIGCMRVVPSSQCDYRMPTFDKDICGISLAFTDDVCRHQGVATALLNRVLVWAGEKGYTKCAVDFESANIPASRFWLKHFQPACYTLLRTIESRALENQGGGE